MFAGKSASSTVLLGDLPPEIFLSQKFGGVFRYLKLDDVVNLSFTSTGFFKLVKKYVHKAKIKMKKFKKILEEKNICDYWVLRMMRKYRMRKWKEKDFYSLYRLAILCSRLGRMHVLFKVKEYSPESFDFAVCFSEACAYGRYKLVKELFEKHKPKKGILFRKILTRAKHYDALIDCYTNNKNERIPEYLIEKGLLLEDKTLLLSAVIEGRLKSSTLSKLIKRLLPQFMLSLRNVDEKGKFGDYIFRVIRVNQSNGTREIKIVKEIISDRGGCYGEVDIEIVPKCRLFFKK